ncbi:MAG: hypothetical protein ABJM86_06555 [Hyphomicrobiales bacterium]
MLNNTDLANAVNEGILSSSQAEQLKVFSKRTRSNDDNPLLQEFETRDEPFRLLRGFRDIFITIGVIFLSIGATAIVLYFIKEHMSSFNNLGRNAPSSFFSLLIGSILLLFLGITLAEIITRRLRLPLASLYLSIITAAWFGVLGIGLLGLTGLLKKVPDNDVINIVSIGFSLSAFIGISFFYLRYRLPFIMLVIAATLAGFLAALVNALSPEFFENNIRFLIGALGFIIFLAAMHFDMRDRLRITRFSECGFWLHLLAAPMMIHAALAKNEAFDPIVIFSAFAFITLVALIIDRRAVLVSSLAYLSIAFYQIITALNIDDDLKFYVPMGIIGLLVVLLGLGWSPIRRFIISLIPFTALIDRVPPVYAGSMLPESDLKA